MRNDQLDAIRRFEGFEPTAKWDYRQASNGYGTRARFAGEVIDPEEAERRFQAEINQARRQVLSFCPNLDDGTVAALTSLTFNTGNRWMKSGLGTAVKAGDLEAARDIFKQYVHAGGNVLAGLVARREFEARWIGCASAEDKLQTTINSPPGKSFLADATQSFRDNRAVPAAAVGASCADAKPVTPCEAAAEPNYDLLTILASLLHFALHGSEGVHGGKAGSV